MFNTFFRKYIRKLLPWIALLAAAAALLAYPRESSDAGREGLKLCLNVIIPGLFPFFVLSSIVVDLGIASGLGLLSGRFMYPLFHVSGCCASALVLGLVGGYPVGAKTAVDLYNNRMCSRTEAERMLAFCSNSGPAFILGVIGSGIFTSGRAGLLLFGIHAAASVCVGIIFRFYGNDTVPRHSSCACFHTERLAAVFPAAVQRSFLSVLNICSFVILFTVVIRLLTLTGLIPELSRLLAALFRPLGLTQIEAESLLVGSLEMSSGIWRLRDTEMTSGCLSAVAFLLGWGGLSVHCQTLAFLGTSGLSARPYFTGKLLHGVLSALLMRLVTRFIPLKYPAGSYPVVHTDPAGPVLFMSSSVPFLLAVRVLFSFILLIGIFIIVKKSGNRRQNVL